MTSARALGATVVAAARFLDPSLTTLGAVRSRAHAQPAIRFTRVLGAVLMALDEVDEAEVVILLAIVLQRHGVVDLVKATRLGNTTDAPFGAARLREILRRRP